MTLFINGNNLDNPFWGLPRVAFELIRSLDTLLGDGDRRKVFGDVILLGRRPASPIADLGVIRYEHIQARNLYLWEHVAGAADGLPSLLGLQGRNPALKENCATLIHSIQVITQPESYSRRARLEARTLLPLIGRRHRTILTGSSFSAEELAVYRIARRDKIRVMPLGIDHGELRSGAVPADPAVAPGRPFVLAQAVSKPHKNIRILLRAFHDPRLSDLDLVLFGTDGREAFEAKGWPVPPNVRFAGVVGDEELARLMRDALCLAFPSITEGFGLPPLEAMARGTPAIVTDGGALPEVCGDAALTVSPFDADGWTTAILRLANDAGLRERYVDAGQKRAAEFTWQRAGEILFDLLAERHAGGRPAAR